MRRVITWLAAVAWLCASAAFAHWSPKFADSSPAIQQWYQSQYSKAHGDQPPTWCCDKADGHAFYGSYNVDADGSVEFDAGGAHFHLPAYMVLSGSNPTGHAVWWYVVRDDGAHVDYCFALGGGV